MKKIEILIIKLVYLGLSILESSKILIYEFWYDYVKLKKQNCVIWIQIVSLYTKKTDDILQKILKLNLILQIMN